MTALTDATFYLPNTTTSVLTNGSGSVTNSRATTKNVFDNEGNLITVKSGGITFGGARCVQNTHTYSEDLTNAAWLKTNCTAPAVDTLTEDSASNQKEIRQASLVTSSGRYHILQCKAKYNGRFLHLRANDSATHNNSASVSFNLQTGAIHSSAAYYGTFTYAVAGISSADVNGYHTCYLVVQVSVASVNFKFELSASGGLSATGQTTAYLGDGTSGVYIKETMLADITGCVLLDAAIDYVSANVLSAPWHGGGADGIKWFATNKDGSAIPDADMLGAHIDPASKTNSLLWCRDLTDAAWVKTNCTPLKTQTGIDGLASSCSLLTATSADATCLQTITTAAVAACTGFWVKRSVGVGNIYITRDNVSWTDITSELSTDDFYIAKIENTSVLNPVVGFKIATSGDAIIVDAGLNHSGTELTLPIFTTTAAVTRNADVVTYQTSGNFSDTAGTILATFKPTYDTMVAGSIVGKASFGLLASTANSGVQAADGTNTVSGLAGTPTGQRKIGARWSGSSLQAFYESNYGVAGSYDGAFNLTTIGLNTGAAGYIRDIAIFNTSLADGDIASAWGLFSTFTTTGALIGQGSLIVGAARRAGESPTPSISVSYIPAIAPQKAEELRGFVQEELLRISQAIEVLALGHLPVTYVEPAKPYDGMLRYADGYYWNPGSGEGAYIYYGGAWHVVG